MNVKLGDKIAKPIVWVETEKRGGQMKHPSATGTVVYIHTKRRYYTLLFRFRGGDVLECFHE